MPILTDFLADGSPQDIVYSIKTDSTATLTKWIVMFNKNPHVMRPNVHVDSGFSRIYEGERIRGFIITERNVLYLKYISNSLRCEGHEVETEIGMIKPEVLQKAKGWVDKVNLLYRIE
jgi:hypothetical protein